MGGYLFGMWSQNPNRRYGNRRKDMEQERGDGMRLFNIIAFTLCMIIAVLDALCGKIPQRVADDMKMIEMEEGEE